MSYALTTSSGRELPWHAVREARELELKCVRDLGVYEKAGEKEAVARYGITPVDTKWVDTDKAFEERAHADQITKMRERVQKRRSTRLVCRDSSIGSVESNNIDRSEPQGNVFNHAHRRVTCVLPRQGPRDPC